MFTEYKSESHKINQTIAEMYINYVLLFSISKHLKQSKNTFTKSTLAFATNPMVSHLLIHSSFFFVLYLLSSFLRFFFISFSIMSIWIFVLNTQNFTFQILFSRPKVQWNLIDYFLISTRNHAILCVFFFRSVDRSVVRSFFVSYIYSLKALCAAIHLGQSCCVLYACTYNRQQHNLPI